MNVLLALSGGVDSSVAAHLLLEQGHRVFSATLKTFCYSDTSSGPKSCCGLEGIEAARAVAGDLGIPHFVYDVSNRFKTEVIDDFVREYCAGRTPNPCVLCNATVKIPDLLQKAKSLGCEYVATGHYARIESTSDGPALFRGMDQNKDQTYFLWALPKEILSSLQLPLGNLNKEQVREIARRVGLASAEKPESQEICFVPPEGYAHFLGKMLPNDHPGFQPGLIRDIHGNITGKHNGFLNYTIGQRKGLGGGHGRKLFVVGIDEKNREIIVGEERENSTQDLTTQTPNFLAQERLFDEPGVSVQIRHRAKPVEIDSIRKKSENWTFHLKEKVRAVTPGQSAVFYLKNHLLGGARIIS